MTSDWQSSGSQVAVEWHWIGDRLVERLSSGSQVSVEWQLSDTPPVVKWHQIGSQVEVKWQSSVTPLVVEWHYSGIRLADQ